MGMDAGTATLFPDGVGEGGEMVPRGWKVDRIDELRVLQRGFDLPYDQRVNGPYQIISASGPSGCHVECKVEGLGVTTGRSGLLGKVFFIHENFWPLNTSLWVKDFRVSQPHHAYFLLKNLDTETYNAGSSVPTLNRNHIHKLPVIVPTKYAVDLFEKLVTPILSKIRKNQNQSNTLAATRDSLLPGLLSGKLRIKRSIHI
jgi:type I restriction enzyme, S subunit